MATDNPFEPKSDNSTLIQVAIYTALALCTIGALTWPAVVLAFVLHFALSRHLSRAMWAVLAVGAGALVLTAPGVTVIELGRWVLSVTPAVDRPLWPFPFVGTFVFAVFLSASINALSGTRVGGAVGSKFSGVGPFSIIGSREVVETEEPSGINTNLPGVVAREGVDAVKNSMTGGIATTDGADRPIGERAFSFAVDGDGNHVELTEKEISMHAGLFGSTGSGKTITIQGYAAALLDLNYSAVVVDLKEDTAPGGLRDFLRDYAAHNGIPFQQVALSDPDPEYWFNPLKDMSRDSKVEAIKSLGAGDDDFYWSSLNQNTLGQLVALMQAANKIDPETFGEPSMVAVGDILKARGPEWKERILKMARVVAETDPTFSKEYYASLLNPTQDEEKTRTGYGAKLTALYVSEAGDTVLRPGTCQKTGMARRAIDVTARGIVYVGADSTSKPDLAKLMSASVMIRMAAYAADRNNGRVPNDPTDKRLFVVDEAAVVDTQLIHALTSKARSAGISCLFSTQSPADWTVKHSDWTQLSSNMNVMMVMGQNNNESARICADYLGQGSTTQQSLMVRDGEAVSASVRDATDYLFSPEDVRGLSTGQMILRVGMPQVRALWASVLFRQSRAGVVSRGVDSISGGSHTAAPVVGDHAFAPGHEEDLAPGTGGTGSLSERMAAMRDQSGGPRFGS